MSPNSPKQVPTNSPYSVYQGLAVAQDHPLVRSNMPSTKRKNASSTYPCPRELNVSHDNHASNKHKAPAVQYRASPTPSRSDFSAHPRPSFSTRHSAVTEPDPIRFVTMQRPWRDSCDTNQEPRQTWAASKSASVLDEWLASSFHDAPYNAIAAIGVSVHGRGHDVKDKGRRRRPKQDRKVPKASIQ